MKRFLIIFSFTMFLVLTVAHYTAYQSESDHRLIDSGNTYPYEFKIPEDSLNANPDRFQSLKKAAKKNGVNLIRTISYYDHKKEDSYTNVYLLLTTAETRLFRNIGITEGRALTVEDMNSPDPFISTERTSSDDQVGVIANFGGSSNYSIHVMDKMLSNYKYSGHYRVEAASKEQYDQFITDYIEDVNTATDGNFSEYFSPEMFTNVTRTNQTEMNHAFDVTIIGVFFVAIMFFTFIFYMVTRTKEISVMKLNGYRTSTICLKIFVLFFTKVFLFSHLVTFPWMFLIKDNQYEFVSRVYLTNFIVYVIITALLTTVCSLYTKYIGITRSIKGKKPIGIIAFLNATFKVIVSIVILISSVNALTSLTQIQQKQTTLDSWSKATEYGVFYPVKTGDDSAAIRAGEYPLDLPTYHLYPYLNQEFQAVYINSDLYTEESLEINSGNDYVRFIRVNPNYLKEYPILDPEGNEIKIDEGVEQTVYLVPEQYKGMENYNFDYFTSVREGRYDLHSDLYNQEDKASSMDITFIYTKSGQEIFSFNPDVMPNHHNMIVDPIIQVMTEANALVPDVFYSSTGNQTLFIKLIDNDPAETYGQLLSELKAYELDDNFPYLVQPNEIILEKINDLQQEAAIIGYILLFSSVLLIMILAQNVYLQFERNRFEYFLKKTFGHTFFMKYKKIVLLLLLTNLLEFIVCFGFIGPEIFNIFVVKMLVETCLVIGLTIYHEGKNVTKVLKEGV